MPPLLQVERLSKDYQVGSLLQPKLLHAVDSIDFTVAPGETVSLVGESGCGKTTTANLVLGLIPPSAGTIRWQGRDLARMRASERRAYRQATNAVFQDPLSSLDPRMRVGASIAEPMRRDRTLTRAARRDRVAEVLRAVGLRPEDAGRYPHEFSGGQRQRVAVARALANRPKLIVLDEPVASLDVSIQAQVMNLLKRLQRETGTSYLMISHNLATVRFISDVVAVMYLGRIVEMGPAEAVLSRPLHPYTQALIAAARATEGGRLPPAGLAGEPPSPFDRPGGCAFHPRCPLAMPRCTAELPVVTTVGPIGVCCHAVAAGMLAAREPLQASESGAP
jgi:oligopeptide/dipeptide ABC transporter ATP-binding protein